MNIITEKMIPEIDEIVNASQFLSSEKLKIGHEFGQKTSYDKIILNFGQFYFHN